MYDGNATTTTKTNFCCVVMYYPLHVYMNSVKFEEIKTKALWLKTLLLSKFVVSLVAS